MDGLKDILARFFRELADYFEDSGSTVNKGAKSSKKKEEGTRLYDWKSLNNAFNVQEIDEIYFGIKDSFKKDKVSGMPGIFHAFEGRFSSGGRTIDKEAKCKIIVRIFKYAELMMECCNAFKNKVLPFFNLMVDSDDSWLDRLEIESWILLNRGMNSTLVDEIHSGLEHLFNAKGLRGIFNVIYHQRDKKLDKQGKCNVIVRVFKYTGCIKGYCRKFEKKVRPFLVYPS